MNPPSEQLIRDYLNQLSVAAKSRLGPGDRQALLDHTRAHIEAHTGNLGGATAAQVRRILAVIGDPIAVAENERARLAVPRDTAAASRATGTVRQIWPPPGVLAIGRRPTRPPAAMQPLPPAAMQPLPPAAMQPLPPAAMQRLPPRTANLPDSSRLAEAASSANPSGPAEVSGRAWLPGFGVPPPRRSPAADDSPPVTSSVPASLESGSSPIPDNSHARSGEPARPAGQSERDEDSQKAKEEQDGADGRPDDEDVPGIELSIELIEPVVYEDPGPNRLSQRASAAASWLRRFGSALAATAVRAPLEIIAVLLLGIGGAIYPPIWLIGALICVLSRKWDLRDKWFGLTMPLVVVIFGATLAIVLGGQHTSLGSYAFEAWLAAGRLSRIGAVLSAIYLVWRVYKGPREPRQPPWSVPRRPG